MKVNADGIITCPMCDLKFFADGYWVDFSKRITKCPFCDEMIKIDPVESEKTTRYSRLDKAKKIRLDKTERPPREKQPPIYYLVTFANFAKGDSLENANWVTKDFAFGGSVWKNYVGGMCPCDDKDVVHEVTMADNIMDLDWKKTYMYAGLEEDFHYGWLSKDGEFIQSARNKIENTAEFILGKSEDQLKKEGWLRLCKIGKDPYFTPRKMITKKQFDWLKDKGYEGLSPFAPGNFSPEDYEEYI
jgi:hypothetical protein